MKLITRDTDYAIRALCFISKQNKNIVSVSDLTKKIKIPRPFLRKILQTLTRKKILKSLKGFGGGFTLNKKPKEIFLIDIIKSFQGKIKLNECNFKKKLCLNKRTCPLKKKIDELEKHVITELNSLTLKFLLN